MDPRATRRRVDTKQFGPCLVVTCWDVIDEDPNMLAAGVAIWSEEEWDTVKAMIDKHRAIAWAARVKALEGERELRRLDPTRTVRMWERAA